MARILLVRYDGVGDTVLLAPLIAALHAAGHELGIVTQAVHVGIFRDDILRCHAVESLEEPHAVLSDIRARQYDVALVATEKPYGYTLGREAGIPRRIGFWNGFAKPFKGLWVRSLCTDIRVRGISLFASHEVEALFALGRGLHREKQPTRDLERLRDLFFRVAPDRQAVLTVQITPKWRTYASLDAFVELLFNFSTHDNLRLIGAASEEPFLTMIEQRSGLGIERHHAVGSWIARIASSHVLLTPDTGAAHIAGMVGTKVIDCFPNDAGKRFQQRWRPWASPAVLTKMSALFKQSPRTLYQSAMQ